MGIIPVLEASRRYFLYRGVAEMRKGFDGLSGLVRDGMRANPVFGDAFIFLKHRRDRMKLLLLDRTGFEIWYKWLEQGTFELPRIENNHHSAVIPWETLLLMVEGIELTSVGHLKRYSLPKSA